MLWLQAFRFELLLQARSLRFRFGVLLCLAMPIAAPYGAYFLLQPNVAQSFGASTYFTTMLDSLRFPIMVLAMIIAGNRADLEGLRQMGSVLSSAGISNAGYLLRRCSVQASLVAALGTLPFLTTLGVLVVAEVPLGDPLRPLGSWLLFILPTAFAFVFLWSALTHITGTELGSLMILLFGNGIAGYFLDRAIRPILGSKLVIHMDWLGFENLQYFILRWIWLIQDANNGKTYRGFLATDTPFSLEQASQRWLASAALYLGFCCFVFPLATFLLRRTRKDLAPLVLPEDHQLRNLLRYVHRLQQRYGPDGALYWERYLVGIGLLCCLSSILFIHHRGERFAALAAEQYAAEIQYEEFPTAPPDARFTSWNLDGKLTREHLDVRATGVLKHGGTEPIARISFGLNAFLDSQVEIEGRRVHVLRRWDRLVLNIEPALQAGDEVRMTFQISGRPLSPHFEIYGRDWTSSFAMRYEAFLDGSTSHRNDFSQSRWNPLISRGGVDLSAENLAPVLRYGSWKLTAKPELEGEKGYEVPGPTAFPLLKIDVDLQVPEGWFIGDSCGNVSDAEGRILGSCTDAFSRYRIVGGLHRIAHTGEHGADHSNEHSDERVVTAAFPGHESHMARQFESIRSVVALSGEAWPGVPPIERLVVVEKPPRVDPFRPTEELWPTRRKFETHGRLLRLRESVTVADELISPEEIVSDVMARDLIRRRDLEASQSWVFEKMFAALMVRRMGVSKQSQFAVVSGAGFEEASARVALLDLKYYQPFGFERKLPALSAYLQSLVGADNLYGGIETFLSRDSDQPGTVAELISDLEHRSGRSLQVFYEHYLAGGSVPKLQLEAVESTATPYGRWRLTGSLRNTGTGEVECPVIAKAEGQSIQQMVIVGEQSATPFRFDFDFAPHTVQLDPELTCFRWVTIGRLQLERVSLLGAG